MTTQANKNEDNKMEYVRCISDGISTTIEMNKENMEGIRKDVQTLKACLSSLASAWEGPAHTTYHNEFNYSLENLEEIMSRTNDIIAFEQLAYDKYMEADDKAAGAIKELWNMIGGM